MITEAVAPEEGWCEKSPDQAHCEHWWDCEPCHYCGFDGGGEECDCPRHNPEAPTRLANNRSPRWVVWDRFDAPDYDTDGTYLTRWRIVQTPWFGIYLHRWALPDPRATLHDHPWAFVSLVLRGGYDEMVPGGDYAVRQRVRWLNVKRTAALHWVSRLNRAPTWTLMLVGRRTRDWGYLNPDGTWTRFDLHPHNDDFKAALARRKAEA